MMKKPPVLPHSNIINNNEQLNQKGLEWGKLYEAIGNMPCFDLIKTKKPLNVIFRGFLIEFDIYVVGVAGCLTQLLRS